MILWKQGASAVTRFLARLRIIFGSAGIGIGGMLPIGTALVTEFAPRRNLCRFYGSRARDRPARAAGAPSRPKCSPSGRLPTDVAIFSFWRIAGRRDAAPPAAAVDRPPELGLRFDITPIHATRHLPTVEFVSCEIGCFCYV